MPPTAVSVFLCYIVFNFNESHLGVKPYSFEDKFFTTTKQTMRMLAEAIKDKFQKPTTLSDPYDDFPQDILSQLVEKSVSELHWVDFNRLFGPYLPAGTYQEVMFYLPAAFQYLQSCEEEALDSVTAVFGFCSKNDDTLKRDGLKVLVETEISTCLTHWVRKFEIIHYDQQACREKGWKRDYFNYVSCSELVAEATSDLVEFSAFADLAVHFYQSLANHISDPTKAAWLLELSRTRFEIYTPPAHDEIQQILADKTLLNNAYQTASSVMSKRNNTYWRDMLGEVDL